MRRAQHQVPVAVDDHTLLHSVTSPQHENETFTVIVQLGSRDAELLGGVGHRVRSRRELAAALEAAAATRGQFQLVEVMLARGAISPALQRFVTGIKRLNQAPAEV